MTTPVSKVVRQAGVLAAALSACVALSPAAHAAPVASAAPSSSAPAAARVVSPECQKATESANGPHVQATIRSAQTKDGCRIEEINERPDGWLVRWSKAGRPVEAIWVQPNACVRNATVQGTSVSVAAQRAFRQWCPESFEKLAVLVRSDAFDQAAGRRKPWALVAAIATLVVGLGAAAVVLVRKPLGQSKA